MNAYVIGAADFLVVAVVEPGLQFRTPGRQFRLERHLFRIGRYRAAGIDAADLHACLGNRKCHASRELPEGVRMDRQTGGKHPGTPKTTLFSKSEPPDKHPNYPPIVITCSRVIQAQRNANILVDPATPRRKNAGVATSIPRSSTC